MRALWAAERLRSGLGEPSRGFIVAPLRPTREGVGWKLSAETAPPRERLDSRLSECVGFRVETAQGLLGVVEELRWRGDRACDLVVRAGKQGRRLLILPLEDVAEVVLGERRVILGLAFHLTTSEGLSAGAQPAASWASEPAAKRGGVPRPALQAALPPRGAVPASRPPTQAISSSCGFHPPASCKLRQSIRGEDQR